jgi:hypothetical protein
MISFTHITYSACVPHDDLPGFDDRLFVFDLYPLRIWDLTLTCSLSSFYSFLFLNWRTSFQREWILEAHSHRFVADFGQKSPY